MNRFLFTYRLLYRSFYSESFWQGILNKKNHINKTNLIKRKMAKLDYNIGDKFTHNEHTYEVIAPTNKMANCHGCTFNRPEINALDTECHIPGGLNDLRCSLPDRIFKEINI